MRLNLFWLAGLDSCLPQNPDTSVIRTFDRDIVDINWHSGLHSVHIFDTFNPLSLTRSQSSRQGHLALAAQRRTSWHLYPAM